MLLSSASFPNLDPSTSRIIREISSSDESSLFEIELDGHKYALKLYHDNGDPGYTEKGRDLNRFRCELNAYQNLMRSGVCERGFVPKFYGYIDRMDPADFYPADFYPAFRHFVQDRFKPKAILLEYLPNAEELNCVNYSENLYPQAVEGMEEIHKAGVRHRDIYPKNLLLVRGNPERLVWIDFDVATTFTEFEPKQLAGCNHEIGLVKGLGECLVRTPLLPMLQVISVLTDEYREMTRLRGFHQIQNSIKGFMGVEIFRQCLITFMRSCNRESYAKF